MAMSDGARWLLVAAAASAGGLGCAHSPASQFGEPGLTTLRRPDLEASLAGHDSALVTVWAQADPDGPLTPPPPFIIFRGHLAGMHDGWLHLLRDADDTVRIGVGHVRRIRLVRRTPRNRLIGSLVGAAGFGLASLVFTHDSDGGDDLAVIGGSVAVGALGGALLVPGSRHAGQIYPMPPPSARGTP
jgi:hypothetical protein